MENYVNYSDIETIDILIRRSIDDLFFNDYEIVQIRNINYGTRFRFRKGEIFNYRVNCSYHRHTCLLYIQE